MQRLPPAGLSHRQNLKTNRLCMKLIAAKIFGDYFNVLLPIDCAIQQDDTSPYYFATVQMDVTCPSMSSENNPEIEELI